MARANPIEYRLGVDGQESPVRSAEELEQGLERVDGRQHSAVSLYQHVGRMRGFERLLYRALGLTTDIEGDAVLVVINGDEASVSFLDPAQHEFQAIDVDRRDADGVVEFRLEDGSRDVAPRAECTSKERALDAIRYFFRHGRKPDWFRYREVR